MNGIYSVHHRIAQDGAPVWVVAKPTDDGQFLMALSEYMTQSSAIAAAQQLNAQREEVAA